MVQQGGIAPGGNNFDCKLRRESTDIEDMFIAHIGGAAASGLVWIPRLIMGLSVINWALGLEVWAPNVKWCGIGEF